MLIFLSVLHGNIHCGAHRKRLIETLPMSTHNICFRQEIRKIMTLIPLLTWDMPECYIVPDKNIILKNIDLICQEQTHGCIEMEICIGILYFCNGQNNYITPAKKIKAIFR